jgi:parallel beta-helix repeat protein
MLDFRLLLRVAACATVVTFLVALGFALPAPAAALVCGETLTASVVLAADLECLAGNGLVIGAEAVTVDLAGHSIVGHDAIGIENAAGFDRVTVKNGTVRGFDTQIRMAGGAGHVVRDVLLRSGRRAIIFEATTTFGKILKVVSFDSDDTAFRIAGDDHKVTQVVIVNTTGTGFLVQGNRNTVAKSTVVQALGSGIHLFGFGEGNVFTGNTISAGQADGIRLEPGGGSGNVVTKNLCEANEGEGIALVNAQAALVTGNTVVGNGANGIRVGGGSVGTTVTKNKVTANYGRGIYVPADASFTTILGNVTHRNRSSGIDTDNQNTTIARNNAEANRIGGIEAPAGVVDGGGNKARYNKNFECSPGVIACK